MHTFALLSFPHFASFLKLIDILTFRISDEKSSKGSHAGQMHHATHLTHGLYRSTRIHLECDLALLDTFGRFTFNMNLLRTFDRHLVPHLGKIHSLIAYWTTVYRKHVQSAYLCCLLYSLFI